MEIEINGKKMAVIPYEEYEKLRTLAYKSGGGGTDVIINLPDGIQLILRDTKGVGGHG